ncbi:MAG: thioredoxin family protein [Dehalococcoidia bacterium]
MTPKAQIANTAGGRVGPHYPAVLLLALAALAFAACAGSSAPSGDEPSETVARGEGNVFPIPGNNSLAVGHNRFSLMLVDDDDRPILDADVYLRFFDLTGDEPVLKQEADAQFIAMELYVTDEESDGGKGQASYNGTYVTPVDFDTPGRWVVDVSVTHAGRQLELIPLQLEILNETPEPAIGDPAPPSRQPTLADVTDIAEIDSSLTPRTGMHDITIAAALAAGKPAVVAFATPAFCENRTCGPLMDTIMDPLKEKYQEATFIHIEPYKLDDLRQGVGLIHVKAMEEWNLQTQPWLFVIDRNGEIAAKFEGITARDEVETALRQALEQG